MALCKSLKAGANIARQAQHDERSCLFLIQLVQPYARDKNNRIEKLVQRAHINIIQHTQTAWQTCRMIKTYTI
ncbi:hypothetical protein D3C78_74420 [compost metagenome]